MIVFPVNIRENRTMKLTPQPLAIGLLSCLLYTGCTSAPMPIVSDQPSDTIAIAPEPTEADEQALPPTVVPFSAETLYSLLVADVALTRQQYQIAMAGYASEAQSTRDARVTEMAFGIARHVQDPDMALQMASLWLEIEPKSGDAHRAMLQAYALLGNAIEALPYAFWVAQNEDDDAILLAVTTIAEGRKEAQIDDLIGAYNRLEISTDQQLIRRLAIAMLLREGGRLEQAESAALAYLQLAPNDQRGSLLLAQIYNQQDRSEDAISTLSSALENYPNSYKLRLQYARLLTLSNRSKALEQFEMLRVANPHSPEINYLLALLYLDRKMLEPARQLFLILSGDSRFSDDALYHLGGIAESNSDLTTAVDYYRQVVDGSNFLAAASRTIVLLMDNNNLAAAQKYLRETRATAPNQIGRLYELEANLLISQDLPEQALEVLSRGIEQRPEDQNLLYARAMIAEQQGDFARAELDLRSIISLDASNAAAMNALGYTMVLHTQRLDEAYDLIQRAYALQPNSAAIIDSMGWVLYKLGETDKALGYAMRAMEMMPDPEIAAHLGEIYWVMGNRKLAFETWHRGLRKTPDHDNIVTTMRRLGASTSEGELPQ
jgi:tetratricopeptide (TPR) repeat protein